MEYLIGVILSLAVADFAAIVGFDRERSFYPTVLIVIASYYVLFALMGASRRTLVIEIVVPFVFCFTFRPSASRWNFTASSISATNLMTYLSCVACICPSNQCPYSQSAGAFALQLQKDSYPTIKVLFAVGCFPAI
jgi:hypothetical protein